jgi:hypothetical protein
MIKSQKILCILALAFSVTASVASEDMNNSQNEPFGTYLTLSQILVKAFGANAMVEKTATYFERYLWLNKAQKIQAANVLQHRYSKARVRYWSHQGTQIWVMHEIGKERPISFAVATKNNEIVWVEVMAFRESRGSEIRLPAFKQQFNGATLIKKGLSHSIDGISGATYSVRAMKKVAKLALLFDRWLPSLDEKIQ